ncbi:ABC transporter ATP-binding protein [Clostridium peptidivorans]|uniref:ABC transporter ATP-binding protein n=1 Tax=Clostridium peptidivorans TaxID=100174 RepID=UPI0015CB2D95
MSGGDLLEAILKGKDIKKVYHMGEVEVRALDGIDFEIYNGEFLVVLGPSGSGKSTLLNMIGGMDKVSSGELYYKDKELHKANEKGLTIYRREAVGFVFQFYNLMPNLTAEENVKLSAELSKDPLNSKEMLKDVGLLDRLNHFPAQMSGGEQQRVAIARALAKNPDILLCDEPTGALDGKTGLMVLKLLRSFNKKYGKTVIIITHNSDIAKTADRVFYIKDGKLVNIIVNEKPLSPEEVSW